LELAVKALVECKETPFQKVAMAVVRALGTLNDDYGEDLPEDDEEYRNYYRKHLHPLEQDGIFCPTLVAISYVSGTRWRTNFD
jgi:hypothetical protein